MSAEEAGDIAIEDFIKKRLTIVDRFTVIFENDFCVSIYRKYWIFGEACYVAVNGVEKTLLV